MCASIRGAKERWKPARRRLSREHGGGFLRDHLLMEGTSGLEGRSRWRGSERKGSRSLAGLGFRVRRGRTRSVRGQTEQPCTRLKTLRRGGIARCGARPFPLGRVVVGFAEVGNAPSSAYPPGVLFPQGGRTPRGRSEHVSLRPAVSSAKAARSGIERSVGARVVDRLQRLARYIFPGSFGWAARHAKASQGSASRQSPSRRRWVWPRRTKGCSSQLHVNVKYTRIGCTRPQG
jgi:hypothetical protein